MRGFDQEEVRSFLNLVSLEFEAVIVQSNNLKEKLAQVEASVSDMTRARAHPQGDAPDRPAPGRRDARGGAQGGAGHRPRGGSEGLAAARPGRTQGGELEGTIQALRVEREAFAPRIRSAVEQHLRLLDMHRNEDDVRTASAS
jgi:hypothetical protein